MSLEGVQRSRGADGKWQIVPYTRCSSSKCLVTDFVNTYEQIALLDYRVVSAESDYVKKASSHEWICCTQWTLERP